MRSLLSRTLAFGALAALPLVQACSNDQAEANPSGEVSEATTAAASASAVPVELVRAEFDVKGMDCGGCVISTRAALRKLEGVQKADASYDDATGKGTAWALYDPAKVTPEGMIAAIGELGYTATPQAPQS